MTQSTRATTRRRTTPRSTRPSLRLERALMREGHRVLVGMDEVGRGALAGPVSVGQLAELYGRCEGAVFPSLLECFSVTPFEAMATGTPLVASDRDFVRNVVGDAALYVDPLDASAWGAAIARTSTDPDCRRTLIESGRAVVRDWPTAADRARSYLELIDARMGRRAAG